MTTLVEQQRASIDAMNAKLRAERAAEAANTKRSHVSPLGGTATGRFGEGRWAVPMAKHLQTIRNVVSKGRPTR